MVAGPHVLSTPEELKPYECDGLSAYRVVPLLVVLPSSIDVGDYLVFEATGAYSLSGRSNFNGFSDYTVVTIDD